MQVPDVKKITGDNWAVSALKFHIIQDFLELGWNVLLSDVDVVVLKVWLLPEKFLLARAQPALLIASGV